MDSDNKSDTTSFDKADTTADVNAGTTANDNADTIAEDKADTTSKIITTPMTTAKVSKIMATKALIEDTTEVLTEDSSKNVIEGIDRTSDDEQQQGIQLLIHNFRERGGIYRERRNISIGGRIAKNLSTTPIFFSMNLIS